MDIPNEQFANSYLLFCFIRGLNSEIESDIRKELKNTKLTFPSFRILWILYFHSDINMSQLTYLTQTNISNVFRQLEKLNKHDYVVIKNGADHRIKNISLSEQGKQIVTDFMRRNTKDTELQIVQLIESIPKEDLAKFIEVCSILSNKLLGEPFSTFVMKSTNDLLNTST
ncbi:DNA-binding transcriptional regulator, MarR family [Oceanobacillus limi]|uniref:DNA-binding transcriptional regulator, MarR family n=1 Tax=Oceanobacillus limi TaxID=930131 RepID=A0A1H9YGD0_9BACI|nr:MarR family transcriptional regulator [Oceanobacillus limi]SES67637.1 DNA-binding transcriptional regulator, MarR family [Oceanobacillus limi]